MRKLNMQPTLTLITPRRDPLRSPITAGPSATRTPSCLAAPFMYNARFT